MNEEEWPQDVKTNPSSETQAEAKMIKEVLRVTVTQEPDALGNLMDKFSFKKAIRVTAWLLRFRNNCSGLLRNQEGPLTTGEVNTATRVWIKRTQLETESDPKFAQDVQQLNLQKTEDGIYVCMGRIQGEYPVYSPTYAKFTKQLVAYGHIVTLHGGVSLTLSWVRENYWVPRLRELTKKVRNRCYGCKRMQVKALNKPPPGNLPKERTTGSRVFEVLGLDYAGPFTYKCYITKKCSKIALPKWYC